MSWYISAGVNNGYPYNTDFPQSVKTDWTNTNSIRLPDNIWRITPKINNHYPYIYYMVESSLADNNMDVGGSQTNYPSGFTPSNRGGINSQFDDTDMHNPGSSATRISGVLYDGLAFRMWCMNGTELARVTKTLNDGDVFDTAARILISQVYGSSVYDGIILCKAYPFPFSSTVVAPTQDQACKLFGKYLLSPYTMSQAVSTFQELDLGSVTLDIQQAWEIESVDYSLYLPYAGVFPLDVRSGVDISVTCTVDLVNGVGEYYVRQNGQTTGIYRATFGIDIPLNLNQGITNSNIIGNITSMVSHGLPLAAAFGGVGAVGAASLASNVVDKTMVSHQSTQAPQVGGSASILCYPYARVIAKIPKMFKNGVGYAQLLGESRECSFMRLDSCSGYVVCRNYKTPIINATEAEKREIESLMNSGVFM